MATHLFLGCVLSLLILCSSAAPDRSGSLPIDQIQDVPLVNVNYYVMSKCPYAQQYVEAFQQTVMAASGLPAIMNLTMDFIATVDPSQPSGFSSKHGPTEVWGDITELCVMDLAKSTFTWWNFVVCMDNDYDSIPNNAHDCATQVGIDWNQLSSCVNSTQGKKLMTASIQRTNSRGWNPRPGSPTVYIGEKCVYGYPPCQNLDPSSNGVLNLICKTYQGPKPSGCNSLLLGNEGDQDIDNLPHPIQLQ